MEKKSIITPVKKDIRTPKISKKSVPKKKTLLKSEIEETLINNFVNLQKVLTNLSIKFDELSDNISKLLQLFEISAKSFTEKYSGREIKEETREDARLLSKLDSLLDQNKTIARGIMLMEERIKQRNAPIQNKREEPRIQRMFGPKSLPRY